MRGELLHRDTGEVMAAGEVTLSRDGRTGVIELERPLHEQFSEPGKPMLLRLSGGEQLNVVIAETVPPIKRHRFLRFPPTLWFSVRHD